MGREESKDNLKRLIKLLEKLINMKTRRSSVSIYRPNMRVRSGGYPLKPKNYILHHNFHYPPEPRYRPKIEKPNYGARVSTEPKYIQKERLVYNPEAKLLLEKIEKHLANLESNSKESKELEPELYSELPYELAQIMNDESEKSESNDEEFTSNVDAEDSLENRFPKTEIDSEPEELEFFEGNESETNTHLEDEFPIDAEVNNGSLDAEMNSTFIGEPTELNEISEVKPIQEYVEITGPNIDVVDRTEAEDLSSLEAELFTEPEPLELEGPDIEPVPENDGAMCLGFEKILLILVRIKRGS